MSLFDFKKIAWNDGNWTIIQDADEEKHVLEVSCFSKDGMVTEVRCRHNDGEEEVSYKGELKDGYSLPMPVKDFEKAFKKGLISLK